MAYKVLVQVWTDLLEQLHLFLKSAKQNLLTAIHVLELKL